MRQSRRNVEHLPFPHDDFLAVHEKAQRALEDVRHLLALVGVDRNERAALQIDLRQHLALAGNDLTRIISAIFSSAISSQRWRLILGAMRGPTGLFHPNNNGWPLRCRAQENRGRRTVVCRKPSVDTCR